MGRSGSFLSSEPLSRKDSSESREAVVDTELGTRYDRPETGGFVFDLIGGVEGTAGRDSRALLAALDVLMFKSGRQRWACDRRLFSEECITRSGFGRVGQVGQARVTLNRSNRSNRVNKVRSDGSRDGGCHTQHKLIISICLDNTLPLSSFDD